LFGEDVLIPLFLAVIGSQAAIWFKLGSLERTVKKSCPFGKCPVFERALNEAAPKRDIIDDDAKHLSGPLS
jgi:hypothetical protein